MNFVENENILFKHQAISSKIEGILIVTNLRLLFQTANATNQKDIVWSNIATIDYSPSHDDRTAIRLKTVIEGDKPQAIQLIGSNKEQRLSEFLRMKAIISDLRKAIPIARPVTPAASTISASEASEVKQPKQISNPFPDTKLTELRSNLLKADRQLASHYKELVGGKILSEEDFWQSHQDLLQSVQVEQFYKYNAKRGMKNFAIIDLIQRDEAGNVSIDLTPEIKDMIFLRYPIVRRAFEQEVPTMMTEMTFWEKFFQTELFHHDSNLRKDTLEENAFFARYASNNSDPPHASTTTTKNRSMELLQLSKVKHRMKIPVNQQIDLTSSYGDYHANEGVELFDPDLQLGGSNQTSAIVNRINDDSALVLSATHIGIDSNPLENGSQLLQSSDLLELKKQPPPHYKEIDLSKLQVTDQKRNNETVDPRTVGQKRIFSELSLPNRDRGYFYLPEINRAERFFRTEMNRLTKLENIRIQSQGLSSESNDQIGALLPDDMKQELYEKFFEVTELLRHFYFLLNRISAVDNGPTSATPFSTKAKAIVTKLLDEKLPSLESHKKRVHQMKGSYDEYTYEAIMATMNGISQLIQRARMTWDATVSQ